MELNVRYYAGAVSVSWSAHEANSLEGKAASIIYIWHRIKNIMGDWLLKSLSWSRVTGQPVQKSKIQQCKDFYQIILTSSIKHRQMTLLYIVQNLFPVMFWLWKEIYLLINWCIFFVKQNCWLVYSWRDCYLCSSFNCFLFWQIKSCKTRACTRNTEISIWTKNISPLPCHRSIKVFVSRKSKLFVTRKWTHSAL